MKHLKLSCLMVVGAIMISACTNDRGTNTVVGGLTGAAIGTQIGSGSGNTAAILGGAAVGALVGSEMTPHR